MPNLTESSSRVVQVDDLPPQRMQQAKPFSARIKYGPLRSEGNQIPVASEAMTRRFGAGFAWRSCDAVPPPTATSANVGS